MSVQGLNYYYSGQHLPYSIWQVYYSFTGTGSTIPSISGANTRCTGSVIQGAVSSGLFNKNSLVKVLNSTGDLTNWTLLCHFSKFDQNDGIIFSSLQSGLANSGFAFGVTAGNRLYVESYSETGPISFTSQIILGSKNLVAVSKVGQAIYFDYFNPNNKQIESEQFSFSSLALLNSNVWTVGGPSGAPSYFIGKNFSGQLYDFALFNKPLRPEEIKSLCRGIVTDISGSHINYNTGALLALGMDAVAYLKSFNSLDTFELYSFTGKDFKTGCNFDATYDSVISEFFAHDNIENTGVHVYLNGVAQLGLTGYQITGTYYTATVSPSGNYLLSGNKIYANQNYKRTDRLVYDINRYSTQSTGFYNLSFSHDGTTGHSLTTNSPSLDHVFFNGLKLVINQDYIASGSTVVFQTGNSLYDGITGALWSEPVDTDYSRSIGSGLSINYTKFARNSSAFWFNGIRQNLGEVYLEISSGDLINGTGLFVDDNLLFDNQEEFFV
jgi:hypothetical protein